MFKIIIHINFFKDLTVTKTSVKAIEKTSLNHGAFHSNTFSSTDVFTQKEDFDNPISISFNWIVISSKTAFFSDIYERQAKLKS